jgi:beta-glucosidase/6-phospho-beta-glucosidase/beta-galactosidase
VRLELNLDFKERMATEKFFFGVAYAPYCEGGLNRPDGFKNSDWEPGTGGWTAGEGIRFWTDYAKHIELAASLGLNAFRMGIEWARCQPSPATEKTAPPAWDTAALDHYADMVETVIDHGMQPIITLHHFTHPLWLGMDIWLDEEGPDLLVAAQVTIIDEINTRLIARGGKRMAHFLVYNEPNLIPLFFHSMDRNPGSTRKGPEFLLPAFDTMLSHYIKAYDGIHDLFERRGWGVPNVGYTIASLCPYEYDKQLDDLVRLRSWGVPREAAAAAIAERRAAWRARVDDLARSQLTDAQYDRYLDQVSTTTDLLRPELFTKTLDALYASPRARKLDYLSLNVYEPFGGARREPGVTERGVPWERYRLDGEVYRTFIQAKNDFNTDLPVYMGENSMGNMQPKDGPAEPRPDGWTRERYLKTYLMEMARCMKEGVPIQGYLYWTLVDDVYPPRLGLYNYDFVNHRILDTDGFGLPSGRVYGRLIAALRSGDKAKIADAFVNAYTE